MAASTNLGATRYSELCRPPEMVGQAGRLGRALDVVAKLEQHFPRKHNALGAPP
ncbi:MAG: hypothetical protein H6Q85_489, partial [candidate division NC10 bacterium]|nr:hypothetical protein [candidate division NC10 bacterium]